MRRYKEILEVLWAISIVLSLAYLMIWGCSEFDRVSDVSTFIVLGCITYLIGNIIVAKKHIF